MLLGDVDAAATMAQAQEEFALAGGWDVDKAIADVLSGLGFSPDQVCVLVCVCVCARTRAQSHWYCLKLCL